MSKRKLDALVRGGIAALLLSMAGCAIENPLPEKADDYKRIESPGGLNDIYVAVDPENGTRIYIYPGASIAIQPKCAP